MTVCDAHPAEPATTTITLPSGRQLTLCTHHTRKVINALIQQQQTFNTEHHHNYHHTTASATPHTTRAQGTRISPTRTTQRLLQQHLNNQRGDSDAPKLITN